MCVLIYLYLMIDYLPDTLQLHITHTVIRSCTVPVPIFAKE